MLLERSHGTHYSLVVEMGKTPLHGFGHTRTGLMNQFPKVIQNRFCKIFRPGDVGINAIVLHDGLDGSYERYFVMPGTATG